MKNKFSCIVIFIVFFTVVLPAVLDVNVSFGLKNPFISPFKVKQYKNIEENPLNGLNLQAIVSSSDADKNVAIINGKPYYIGSEIKGRIVVNIKPEAVIIKLRNGKIVKLILPKFERFKK
ncbi:MAG TPA: hypothetical protein ENI54_03425 [bacterium]|nr:hypothetical protein [bacterium]